MSEMNSIALLIAAAIGAVATLIAAAFGAIATLAVKFIDAWVKLKINNLNSSRECARVLKDRYAILAEHFSSYLMMRDHFEQYFLQSYDSEYAYDVDTIEIENTSEYLEKFHEHERVVLSCLSRIRIDDDRKSANEQIKGLQRLLEDDYEEDVLFAAVQNARAWLKKSPKIRRFEEELIELGRSYKGEDDC